MSSTVVSVALNVATPELSEIALGGLIDEEPAPCESVTFLPGTGLPAASSSVTVIVVELEPSWTTELGLAETVEVAASTPPAATSIDGVDPLTAPAAVSVAVIVCGPACTSVTLKA